MCLNILMPRLGSALFEIVVAVADRSYFDSLQIHLSPLAVVFLLGQLAVFLASLDPVS